MARVFSLFLSLSLLSFLPPSVSLTPFLPSLSLSLYLLLSLLSHSVSPPFPHLSLSPPLSVYPPPHLSQSLPPFPSHSLPLSYSASLLGSPLHTNTYPGDAVLLKMILTAQFWVFLCDKVCRFSCQGRAKVASHVDVFPHELKTDQFIPGETERDKCKTTKSATIKSMCVRITQMFQCSETTWLGAIAKVCPKIRTQPWTFVLDLTIITQQIESGSDTILLHSLHI